MTFEEFDKLEREGNYVDNNFGSASDIYLPHWIQEEIAKFFSVPFITRRNPWYFRNQLDYDVMVSLARDVSNQEDFELLADLLTFHAKTSDKDGERLLEEVWDAADRYVAWARKTYLQKQKILLSQRGACLLCQLSQRLGEMDVCAACRREYYQEEQRIRNHLYRARKAGTPATLTLGQWVMTLRRYHHLCAYCQQIPYEVIEHHIPISAGGGTTEENCVPACRSCNSKKSDDHPEHPTPRTQKPS